MERERESLRGVVRGVERGVERGMREGPNTKVAFIEPLFKKHAAFVQTLPRTYSSYLIFLASGSLYFVKYVADLSDKPCMNMQCGCIFSYQLSSHI